MAHSKSLAGVAAAGFSERTRENRLAGVSQQNLETEQRFRQTQADRSFELRKSETDVNLELRRLEIDRAKKGIEKEDRITKLKEGIISAQQVVQDIDQYLDFVKTYPKGKALGTEAPGVKQAALDLIDKLGNQGMGTLFLKDAVIPIDIDKDGNPIFLDMIELKTMSDTAKNQAAGNQERINVLEGGTGQQVFSTTKEPSGTRIVF